MSERTCPNCQGDGELPCPKCHTRGYRGDVFDHIFGPFPVIAMNAAGAKWSTVPLCNGRGTIYA